MRGRRGGAHSSAGGVAKKPRGLPPGITLVTDLAPASRRLAPPGVACVGRRLFFTQTTRPGVQGARHGGKQAVLKDWAKAGPRRTQLPHMQTRQDLKTLCLGTLPRQPWPEPRSFPHLLRGSMCPCTGEMTPAEGLLDSARCPTPPSTPHGAQARRSRPQGLSRPQCWEERTHLLGLGGVLPAPGSGQLPQELQPLLAQSCTRSTAQSQE